jgi:threonine aldolase
MMIRIDLRSDTVTKPTDAMRQVMANAEVGDDVCGDDPTVQRLEEATAEFLGKPAAIYMPSGTMANQVALKVHTVPGDEIIIESQAHMYWYESGAPAVLSGVMCQLIDTDRGIFSAADLALACRHADQHYARTTLVCVENTHNRGGGSIWSVEQLAEVESAARERGLKMHMDGARLWNASVASGVSEAQYATHFDSVSVCFSKGLGAPIGSVLVGEKDFIAQAHRFRKMFGGGMRQVGIIAAGALYALENHRDRLADDHANAQHLAAGLSDMKGVAIDPASVETNLVFFDVAGDRADDLVDALAAEGIAILATGPGRIRAVLNLGVSRADIDELLLAINKFLNG